MPRPTRSRVASTRSAPISKAQSPAQPSEDSTDTNGLSGSEKENTRPALANRGRISTRTSSGLSNAGQIAALEEARRRRDLAMDRLDNITSTSVVDSTENHEFEISVEVEVGRRVAATPMAGRLAEMSGLDLDDDMFDDLNTSRISAGPASAQRSHDTSAISASHFKRRPRAGSFLSRDDGPIRPSSRAGPNTPGISSTFNIGVFKRRAREPSILGTVQKERAQRPELETDSGEKSDEDEEAGGDDESAPEGQSPPPRRSKRHSGTAEANQMSLELSPGNNSRKRKSTESHVQRVRSDPYTESEASAAAQSYSLSETESENASRQPSLPLPRTRGRPSTPAMDEEDAAPPLSSDSSEGEAPIWPPLQSLAKGRAKRPASASRRTPVRDDSTSDMSSPPSLTHSPNVPVASPPPQRAARATRKVLAKQDPKITTADLTGLLPRRRRKNARADPFAADDSEDEVDASGLGNDDDELSYLDVRARRRPASRAGTANQSATRNRSGQRKGKETASSTKPTRTYGRLSKKENHEDDEAEDSIDAAHDENATETSEETDARVGLELKEAARKFQEVDKWELEYEDMTQSSSPRDAR